MFISEPIIEFPSSNEAVSSRAVGAVVMLVGVGIVLLVVLTMLSVGSRPSRVTHPTPSAVGKHLAPIGVAGAKAQGIAVVGGWR